MKTHLLLMGAALVLAAFANIPAAEAEANGITIYRPNCSDAQNSDPVASIAGSAGTPNASRQQSPPAGIWIFRTPRYYASKPFVAVITADRTVEVFCGPVLPVPRGIRLY